MPDFAIREDERRGDQHVRVSVYVGVDAQHRQLAGTLTLYPEEWDAWQQQLGWTVLPALTRKPMVGHA